jgi:hypothetical protein
MDIDHPTSSTTYMEELISIPEPATARDVSYYGPGSFGLRKRAGSTCCSTGERNVERAVDPSVQCAGPSPLRARSQYVRFEGRFRVRLRVPRGTGSTIFRFVGSVLCPLDRPPDRVRWESKILEFSFRREVGEGTKLGFPYRGVADFSTRRTAGRSPCMAGAGRARLDHYSRAILPIRPRAFGPLPDPGEVSAHAAYRRYSQFLNLVAEEGELRRHVVPPWSRTLAPGRADHYILQDWSSGLRTRRHLDRGYWKPLSERHRVQ